MTTFYAQPYSYDHTGFYFDSYEKYIEGMRLLEQEGCEEVEIQFIDGDDHLTDLGQELNPNQIEQWFEEIEPLRGSYHIAAKSDICTIAQTILCAMV
jgi:hypothetical protein